MQELSDSYMERAYRPPKYVKKEIIEETYSKEHKQNKKGKKPKRYIDLNKYACIEENQSVYSTEAHIEPRNNGIEESQMTIKELKQEKKSLEVWNGKLQKRVQSLKEKHKSQRELLKNVGKMNIKLYWSNVILKTKLKQEKFQSSTQQ